MKNLKRIYIIGPSGSGKSFLAKKLSNQLKIPAYDLDDIFWLKKPIKKRPEQMWKPLLERISKKQKWIIEGIFHAWVESAIKKSDLIIWLDFPPRTLSWRLLTRHIKRKLKGSPYKIKDTLYLLKYSKKYSKKETNLYLNHKKLIKKVKTNLVIIKNKKQLNNLLEKLK